jgi:Zn-dependent protease with chaperone function
VKIVARRPQHNVNISRTHPLVELAWLLGGVLAIVAVVYLALGLIVDQVVDHLSAQTERHLFAPRIDEAAGEGTSEQAQFATTVLNRLLVHAPDLRARYDFDITVQERPDANALALPGGHIVLLRGLFDDLSSENELAMVLGHELGHYAARDHLRRMGRGLVLGTLTLLVLGRDSDLAQSVLASVGLAESSYGRSQEAAADLYGLELMQAVYGHVGGATAFFERAQADDLRWLAWLSTHPQSADRIAALRDATRARGYIIGRTLPLPETVTAPR